MKSLVTALAMVMVAGISTKAQATVAAPLWTCKLDAKVQDHSASLILGVISVEGQGRLKCITALGQKVSKKVYLVMEGISIGPDFSMPTNSEGHLQMYSAAFGLSSLDQIYGKYGIKAGVSAQLGDVKASADYDVVRLTPSLRNGNLSTGITLAVQKGGSIGLGVDLNVKAMKIMTEEQWQARQARLAQERYERENREIYN